MTAYRYIQVDIFQNNSGDGFIQVPEIELAATVGGADLTVAGSGAATVSATLQAGSAAGTIANDGTATFAQWSGATTRRQWEYDFGVGNAYDIAEVRILASTGNVNRSPGVFFVRGRNSASDPWTELWFVHVQTTYVAGVWKSFPKPTASAFRYIINRFSNCLSNVFSIAEMKAFSSVGGANILSGGTPISSSGTASNAFDGNTTTFWFSSTSTETEYLGYDLGVGNTAAPVGGSLVGRQSTSSTEALQWPGTLAMMGGVDRENFVTLFNVPKVFLPWNVAPAHFYNPTAVPAPNPTANHRWWGIIANSALSTASGHSNIEFRDGLGAQMMSGGTAAMTKPFDYTTRPEHAWDGATTESGAGTPAHPQVYIYDMGYGNDVGRPTTIMLQARSSNLDNNNQAATDFDLFYSDDGHTLNILENFTTPATWSSAEQRVFGVTQPPATGLGRRMSLM